MIVALLMAYYYYEVDVSVSSMMKILLSSKLDETASDEERKMTDIL